MQDSTAARPIDLNSDEKADRVMASAFAIRRTEAVRVVGALGIEPRQTEPGYDGIGTGLAKHRGRSDERRLYGLWGQKGSNLRPMA